MVLGGTIHLYNTGYQEFMQNRRWLRHELAHIRQFRQYGFMRFLWLYFIESVRQGYQQNRFEVEARAAEWDDRLDEYSFVPRKTQVKPAIPHRPPGNSVPKHHV